MKKERLMLVFSTESYGKPITYTLIHDYNLKINILKAEVTPGEEGRLLIDMEGPEASLNEALAFLAAEKIVMIPVNRQIVLNEDRCVDCGACTAVCFSQALAINRDTWKVEFHPAKCIVCGLCINACPLQAISGNGFKTGAENKN